MDTPVRCAPSHFHLNDRVRPSGKLGAGCDVRALPGRQLDGIRVYSGGDAPHHLNGRMKGGRTDTIQAGAVCAFKYCSVERDLGRREEIRAGRERDTGLVRASPRSRLAGARHATRHIAPLFVQVMFSIALRTAVVGSSTDLGARCVR